MKISCAARRLISHFMVVNERCASCCEIMRPRLSISTVNNTILCRMCRWKARFDGYFQCGFCLCADDTVSLFNCKRLCSLVRKSGSVIFACKNCSNRFVYTPEDSKHKSVKIELYCRLERRDVHPQDIDDSNICEMLNIAAQSACVDTTFHRTSLCSLVVRSPTIADYDLHTRSLTWQK